LQLVHPKFATGTDGEEQKPALIRSLRDGLSPRRERIIISPLQRPGGCGTRHALKWQFYDSELFFVGARAGAFPLVAGGAPVLAPLLMVVASVFSPIVTSFAPILAPCHSGGLSLCI